MRKPHLMIALAVLAGVGALAVSGRLLRFGGGGEASVMEPLFGAAPAPAFRSMRRVVMLDIGDGSGSTQNGEHFYTVQEANGWQSVVRDSAVYAVPGGTEPATVVLKVASGPLDLFELSMDHPTSGADSADARDADARDNVREVSGVEGRLFPLAVGNRLRFETLEGGLVTAGQLDRPTADSYVYEFTVTRQGGDYVGAMPTVPGPVYVIDVQVQDTKYGHGRHLEVHYAPALGAAVRVRTLGDGPPTDERLTSWEPAR
ncbi:MAG TPA: hypothetical protein VFS20_03145 [Longimicrobium sp.]|nr:hypothetical protein [Longimicrobium sp.]